MKVAIIGSNGLLSNEFGAFCATQGYSVTVYGIDVPTKYPCSAFHQVDLMHQEIDAVQLAQNDVILYAAGAGIQSNLNESYETIYTLNTLLPIKLCKALSVQTYRGTFVTLGSYFEIGAQSEDRLFSEDQLADSALSVPNDYSISKRLLTRFVRSNTPAYNHLHLILPTIYGPTEASHRLIPYTLSMIARSEVPQFTTGTQVRQYLYIGDIPKILFRLVELQQSGVLNIAGDQRFTVKELVSILYAQRGKQLPERVFGGAKRADVSMENLQLDDRKLRELLPDFRFTPLSEVLPLY